MQRDEEPEQFKTGFPVSRFRGVACPPVLCCVWVGGIYTIFSHCVCVHIPALLQSGLGPDIKIIINIIIIQAVGLTITLGENGRKFPFLLSLRLSRRGRCTQNKNLLGHFDACCYCSHMKYSLADSSREHRRVVVIVASPNQRTNSAE